MSTNQPWIVCRFNSTGEIQAVFESDNVKQAKNWLMYIGEVGDALFKTKHHPRYTGDGDPVYEAHLIERQKVEHNQQAWLKQCGITEIKFTFLEMA